MPEYKQKYEDQLTGWLKDGQWGLWMSLDVFEGAVPNRKKEAENGKKASDVFFLNMDNRWKEWFSKLDPKTTPPHPTTPMFSKSIKIEDENQQEYKPSSEDINSDLPF